MGEESSLKPENNKIVAENSELAQSKNRFWLATALESAADAIVLVDSNGHTQFVNPAAARLTGWSHPEAKGKHFTKIISLEHAGAPVRDDLVRLANLHEEPLSLGTELVLVARDGRKFAVEAEISASSPSSNSAGSVVFTFRDITQRKWEEHQQRQEYAVRAIERLAETTTHALNNLLTSILGHGELLLHNAEFPPEQQAIVAEMHSAAVKVAAVVRQLSSLSGTRFATRRDVDVEEVIQRILPGFFPDTIAVAFERAPGVRTVNADPNQLEQVLFNILSNAREATAGPGEIGVRIQNTLLDAPERLKEARSFVTVRVRDTGAGMSQDVCEHIFEPFFSTRKDEGHAGLGLSIAQGIIREYHGFFEVKSQPGVGTEVTFGIPAVEEDRFAYLDKNSGAAQAATVFVVEDDDAIRQLLRKILEKNGYAVVEARDGEDALMVAELHEGRVDVLITDIAMPGMSGPELVRSFTLLHPEAKFLLISGFSADRMGPASSLPRGVDFLPKPFHQKELLLRVKKLLSGDGTEPKTD